MWAQVSIPGGQPTSHEFLIWLGCAVLVIAAFAFLVGLFNQAAKARAIIKGKATEITPQPLDVRVAAAAEFVKQQECLARHSESVKTTSGLQAQIEDLRQERKDDTADLHEKVNGVAREVSELKATTVLQNQQLARMDAKLDRLVEKRLKEI